MEGVSLKGITSSCIQGQHPLGGDFKGGTSLRCEVSEAMPLTPVSKGGKPLAGSRKGGSPCGALEARKRPVKAGDNLKGDGV